MYGCIGPFCFGEKKDAPKSYFNLNMNSIKSQVVNSVSKVVSKAKDEIGTGQVQNVTINGYVGNGPDIIISQTLKFKAVSNSKLSSVINDETLKKVANDLDGQLKKFEEENKNLLSKPSTKNLYENVRKNMVDVIKSDATRKVLQTKITTSLSIQNQDIYINFSDKVGELVLENVRTVRGPDNRPVIEITQELVNNIYTETVMKNLVSVIVNNSDVAKDALALKQALADDTFKERTKGTKSVAKFAKSDNSVTKSNENTEKNCFKYDKHEISFLVIILIIFIFLFFSFIYNKK